MIQQLEGQNRPLNTLDKFKYLIYYIFKKKY